MILAGTFPIPNSGGMSGNRIYDMNKHLNARCPYIPGVLCDNHFVVGYCERGHMNE